MTNLDKNKNRLVHFRMSEREAEMLDALCNRLGKRTAEFLRTLITEKFLKVFPKYAERKGEKPVIPEKELTPEQACEQAGGRVETVEGIRMCVIQISKSMRRTVPISDTARITQLARESAKRK